MNKRIITVVVALVSLTALTACSTKLNLTSNIPPATLFETTEAPTVAETDAINASEITTEMQEEKVEADIPQYAVNYEGHAYYLFNSDWIDIADYDSAVAYCEEKGGYLAEISDKEENAFLFKYVQDEGYASAYFGYLRDPSNSSWSYPHGSDTSYTNWAADQPDSGLANNYAKFGTAQEDGSWVNDCFEESDAISDNRLFLCEWDEENNNYPEETDAIESNTN